MSMKSGNKIGVRALGLGVLALAGGSMSVQAARIFCRFVSASRTSIASQNGYAEALVDIAESICNEATGQPVVVPIDERITAVAFAQAQAVAEVVGTCSGDGNAQLKVNARRRAENRATAVGVASSNIVATSGVCGLCDTALSSFAVAVEQLTATAVADLNLDATYQFNGQPLTVNVVEQQTTTVISNLLATIVGEVRASAIDGCSAFATGTATTGTTSATCDVDISADDIITEVNAVADAGLQVQAFACDGDYSFIEVELAVREVATAVAQAVSQATIFCETSGGPGTQACAVSSGTVTAIASAQAQAFSTAIAEAYGPECDCELSSRIDTQEVQSVIATATTSSLAEACISGTDFAFAFDFQIAVEEKMVEALAEVLSGAVVGVAECEVFFGVVAEIKALP